MLRRYFVFIFLVFSALGLAQEEQQSSRPYLLIDPENALSVEQVQAFEQQQDKLYKEGKTAVSYAITNVHFSNEAAAEQWQLMIDKLEKPASETFHLLVLIGNYSDGVIIDYKITNPPPLQEPRDMHYQLEEVAKRDIESESSFDFSISKCREAITDSVNYIYHRPLYEINNRTKEKKRDTLRAGSKRKRYFRLAVLIILTILTLCAFYALFKYLSNRRPFHFPDLETPKRLGAKKGASISIAQRKH